MSSYREHSTYNDYVLQQHENSKSKVNVSTIVPMFQGMVTLQVMIETFAGPFELTVEDMIEQNPPLLHHPWLQDKKEIFNECENVEKNCKKGGVEKNVTRKHKANKKSKCIQSHLNESQTKLQTKKECKNMKKQRGSGKKLNKQECEEM